MKQRRRFTKEFEEEAVRLVQTSGRTRGWPDVYHLQLAAVGAQSAAVAAE